MSGSLFETLSERLHLFVFWDYLRGPAARLQTSKRNAQNYILIMCMVAELCQLNQEPTPKPGAGRIFSADLLHVCRLLAYYRHNSSGIICVYLALNLQRYINLLHCFFIALNSQIRAIKQYNYIHYITIQYSLQSQLFIFQGSFCFFLAYYREVVTCSNLFLFGALQLQHAKHNILCVPLCYIRTQSRYCQLSKVYLTENQHRHNKAI